MNYPSHQVRWSDGAGEHTARVDGPRSLNAATTIALALSGSLIDVHSYRGCELWEVGTGKAESTEEGTIYFRLVGRV